MTNVPPPSRRQLEECMNCQEHSLGKLSKLPWPRRTGPRRLTASGKPRFRSAWKRGVQQPVAQRPWSWHPCLPEACTPREGKAEMPPERSQLPARPTSEDTHTPATEEKNNPDCQKAK